MHAIGLNGGAQHSSMVPTILSEKIGILSLQTHSSTSDEPAVFEAIAPPRVVLLQHFMRSHRRRRGSPQAMTAVMCICARLFDEALRVQFNREPVACEEASATSAPPQHRYRGARCSPRVPVYTTVTCTIPPLKTVWRIPGVCAAKDDREARWVHTQLV